MLEQNFNEAYAKLEHNIPKSKSEEVKRLISCADDNAYHKIMQLRLESKNIFKSHSGLIAFVCGLIGTLFLLLNIIIYGWLMPYTVNKIQYTSYVSSGLRNIALSYTKIEDYFTLNKDFDFKEDFTDKFKEYDSAVEAYESKLKEFESTSAQYEVAKEKAEEDGKDSATDKDCIELLDKLSELKNDEESGYIALEANAKLIYEQIANASLLVISEIKTHAKGLEYLDNQYAKFTKMSYGNYIIDANNEIANTKYSIKIFDDYKINGVSLSEFTFKPLIALNLNLEYPTFEEFDIKTADPVAKFYTPVEEVINENTSVFSQMNTIAQSLDNKCSSMCFMNKVLGLGLLVFDVIALIVVAAYFGWSFLYTSLEAQEINYQNVKEILS